MSHPLDFIPPAFRRFALIAFVVVTLVIMAVFQVLDAPLRTPAAPNGIVSFELAATAERSQAIVDSWDAQARQSAAFGLGLDYLFMPAYALSIALATLLAGGKHGGVWRQVGNWLGWGQFVAAISDGLENFALWKILLGPVAEPWPAIAALAAILKFSLIALGLLFALAGWLIPKKQSPPAVSKP